MPGKPSRNWSLSTCLAGVVDWFWKWTSQQFLSGRRIWTIADENISNIEEHIHKNEDTPAPTETREPFALEKSGQAEYNCSSVPARSIGLKRKHHPPQPEEKKTGNFTALLLTGLEYAMVASPSRFTAATNSTTSPAPGRLWSRAKRRASRY